MSDTKNCPLGRAKAYLATLKDDGRTRYDGHPDVLLAELVAEIEAAAVVDVYSVELQRTLMAMEGKRVRLLALASRAGVHPDTVRMDWLADRNNIIGNVQLPAVCVMNNLHDMRAAIDEAMRLDPEIAAEIAAAPEPGEVGSDNSTNDEDM